MVTQSDWEGNVPLNVTVVKAQWFVRQMTHASRAAPRSEGGAAPHLGQWAALWPCGPVSWELIWANAATRNRARALQLHLHQ